LHEERHDNAPIEADSRNRPPKNEFLVTGVLHSGHGMAGTDSRPDSFHKNLENNEICVLADTNNWLEIVLLSSFPICSIDLTEDGKLGYGFTSADELEEIDIGPGDKPRPTFISKKLHPSLREPMITLLKEYADCFA
jgi:hypothetical protein